MTYTTNWLIIKAKQLQSMHKDTFDAYSMGECDRIATDSLKYLSEIKTDTKSHLLVSANIYFNTVHELSKLYHLKNINDKPVYIQEVIDLCRCGLSKFELLERQD